MSHDARKLHLQIVLIPLLALTIAAGCGDSDSQVEGPATAEKDTTPDPGDTSITPEDTATVDTAVAPDAATPKDTYVATDVPEEEDAVVAPDVPPEDTFVDPTKCPGGEGCACADADGCDNGFCLDTHEGKKCAQKCVDSCDSKGYSCNEIGTGTDKIFVCVSDFVSLCAPCQTDSQCQVNGIKSVCLDYGDLGKFCGGLCTEAADCPGDYECISTKDGTGADIKQCQRKKPAGSDTPALCECSDWAKTKGVITACNQTNEYGSCASKAGEGRKCEAGGMSACKAKEPKAEVCNGEDDDCDGKVDILPDTVKCSATTFKNEGSMTDCKANSDCTAKGEECDIDGSGKCKVLIGACAGQPMCINGKFKCDAKAPSLEKCNDLDDDCDGATDEGFEWENPADGAKLKVGQSCGTGPCAGGSVTCKDNITAFCSTFSKVTAEKGACDDVDNDCNGKVDDLACDDGDMCTKDLCDGAAKKCTNEASVDCNDNDQCTEDKCASDTGKCDNTKKVGSCDDGNKCTVGDACGDAAGKYVCVPGSDGPKCDDDNPCTDDVCKTDKGCDNTPNAAKIPCYSGPKDTEGKGACKGGSQLCKDGKKLEACEGQVVPNKAEGCDGKDDNCNGQTDEGCKPTSVAVTFSSAYVAGKSGQGNKALDVQMLVGPSGPVGSAKGQKHEIEFGFMAWLMALVK